MKSPADTYIYWPVKEQALPDDQGYILVHCGRQTSHIMHSSLEDAFAYVARSVRRLRVKIEVESDVLAAPVAVCGDREYAGTPWDGVRGKLDWRGLAGAGGQCGGAGRGGEAPQIRGLGVGSGDGVIRGGLRGGLRGGPLRRAPWISSNGSRMWRSGRGS